MKLDCVTNPIRSRVVGGVAVVALLMSACASGSDDEAVSATEAPVVVGSTDVADSEAPAVEPVEAESVELESPPSLPANIWPEEIVEPVEVEPFAGKNVVTRAEGVEGDGVLPDGVGSVTAVVTSPGGEVCEVCLWLADDDATRQRGLMGVTDLGDAVGMAFVWEQPRTGNFFMFQTPTPLSIAWFDDAGAHVGQADMDPCLEDNSATCERYTADSPYVVAVEMFGGQLDVIGIGPGSSIELLDLPCA